MQLTRVRPCLLVSTREIESWKVKLTTGACLSLLPAYGTEDRAWVIFESLLHALKEHRVVLQDGKPTTLLDLGCGEGHTAYEMIDAINRVHPQGDGINYYGWGSRAGRLITVVGSRVTFDGLMRSE
jgi:hypothetical protein